MIKLIEPYQFFLTTLLFGWLQRLRDRLKMQIKSEEIGECSDQSKIYRKLRMFYLDYFFYIFKWSACKLAEKLSSFPL